MRTTLSARLEKGRLLEGHYGSAPGDLHGAFVVHSPRGIKLKILSSGVDHQYGWEHVSVSSEVRPPIWEEMCWIKDLFWTDEECVMQLHPPKADYVNNHPNCLHLWRPLKAEIPRPKKIQV